MIVSGMIAPGDTIGDPFGGQAGGALDAMRNGLHWRGVELEPRFVELGNQNIGLWMGKYAPHFDGWGTAVLVQGDSRNFAGIVGGLSGAICSPPFGEATTGAGIMVNGHHTELRKGEAKKYGHRVYSADNQGSMPGNLAHLKAKPGDLSAAISSPPYADTIENGDAPGARWDAEGHPGNPDKVSSDASYGRSPGQVGRLDGVISSSPFENANQSTDEEFLQKRAEQHRNGSRMQPDLGTYGSTPGNTGNATGETFWTASREIVAQTYAALKPGGYAAFVCGDFVRRGKRVYFGQQWLDLCVSVGFEAHTWAIAWKTEHNGTQTSLFGDVEKRTDRVSFFRRLANEKNPDNAILNEDVIIVRKPK
jgi:hypothetical protein